MPDLRQPEKHTEVFRKCHKGNVYLLIINISSLQLIPMNIVAYRSQYGSVHPAAVVGPGLAATIISTATAVIFCRIVSRRRTD